METDSNTVRLDARLLNAMKRLRMENIGLQKQLRSTRQTLSEMSSEATDTSFRSRDLEMKLAASEEQINQLQTLRNKLARLEEERSQWDAQRAAAAAVAQRQAAEISELKARLQAREDECSQLQAAEHATRVEMEELKAKARTVIAQHYQAMKSAQQQSRDAMDQARRSRAQLEVIRPVGHRKVLPPRSLRPSAATTPGGKP